MPLQGLTAGCSSFSAQCVWTPVGRALERGGRWSESVEMELEGLHADLDPFIVSRVLRGFTDLEMAVRFYWIYDALQMVEKMGTKGTSPDIVSYTTVVGCLCDDRRFSEAVGFWEEMVGRGLKPDVVACGTLIFGLCKNHKVGEAFELASRILSVDIELNVSIYNALISGFWRAGSIDKAYKIVSMWRNGGFCDTVSCNILIDAFCKAKKVNSALNLFKEMGYKGIQADAVTYGILINGLFSVGYSNLAEELFDHMLNNKIVLNVNVYNIELHNLSIEALDLFKEMGTRGVEPDNLTFKYMISGLLDEGKATLAYEVGEYMMDNDIILDRDVSESLISVLKRRTTKFFENFNL
uniref:Pentacotripeptide-repeat region of PRORP domain-containing protein n=1 Tax=Oryza punctata TaxID=4537 RepID=A0A0E0LTA5_ORYPU